MFEMSHADFSETMAGPAGPPPSHLLRSGHHLKGQQFVCSPPKANIPEILTSLQRNLR